MVRLELNNGDIIVFDVCMSSYGDRVLERDEFNFIVNSTSSSIDDIKNKMSNIDNMKHIKLYYENGRIEELNNYKLVIISIVHEDSGSYIMGTFNNDEESI